MAAAESRPASRPASAPASGPASASTPSLGDRARADGIEFILALFVDLIGKPCAKLVPIEAIDELETNGVGFAGYAAGALGQQPSDPDIMAIPDPASYAALPFLKPGLAMVHCDPHVNGERWPYAPRVILKAMLEKAAESGLELFVGAEVEYFLLKRSADGTLGTADSFDTADRPCYDVRDLTRMYDHLTAVSKAMNFLGWGNYANDHEDGNGQFEQNFNFADALTTADRVISARYIISTLAEQRGMTATYMPKPFTDRTGNGLHFHLSLWRDGEALFPGEKDARGLGLSELAYSFVAGILEHACALQAVIGPTVNSYKRTGPSASSRTGASWSPNRASYGGNDRTHYLRVPDHDRVELRGADGSANPYLAMAAALAAGLDGIEHGADPGQPGSTDAALLLPMTLLHAVDALGADKIVGAALDAAGPGVSDYFSELKRKEFFDWHSKVTPWEVDTYLTAF